MIAVTANRNGANLDLRFIIFFLFKKPTVTDPDPDIYRDREMTVGFNF
jgi:hypothetical protein